ncbi:hypothetical protein CIRG_05075 [Coccidioides immitis RMSCC 2394]|uniref:Uncharacterized protein n=1 Tax=Coccidioides immitis RMSCC 2394 TaxID=404692 RepID=A0A0J6YEC0_COCIT|nr:hypothetical protein CIRG_05075 [Coccidioides immitis RMSCC 2394]
MSTVLLHIAPNGTATCCLQHAIWHQSLCAFGCRNRSLTLNNLQTMLGSRGSLASSTGLQNIYGFTLVVDLQGKRSKIPDYFPATPFRNGYRIIKMFIGIENSGDRGQFATSGFAMKFPKPAQWAKVYHHF